MAGGQGKGEQEGDRETYFCTFRIEQFKSLTLLNLLSQAAKVHLIHQEKK